VRETARQAAGLAGILEKKGGVSRKAAAPGRVHHVTGRAAYPYEHINPALRNIIAHVAVQGLSATAEFKHFPQNGYPPPRRRVS